MLSSKNIIFLCYSTSLYISLCVQMIPGMSFLTPLGLFVCYLMFNNKKVLVSRKHVPLFLLTREFARTGYFKSVGVILCLLLQYQHGTFFWLTLKRSYKRYLTETFLKWKWMTLTPYISFPYTLYNNPWHDSCRVAWIRNHMSMPIRRLFLLSITAGGRGSIRVLLKTNKRRRNKTVTGVIHWAFTRPMLTDGWTPSVAGQLSPPIPPAGRQQQQKCWLNSFQSQFK